MLKFLSILSGILPIFFFLFLFKRNKEGGAWVIFLYCITSLFFDLFYGLLKAHIHPFYIYSSITLIEYTLFTLFLYLSIRRQALKYVLIAGSLGLYFVIFYNIFKEEKDSFDSTTASLEAILIIVYCIFFLYEQIKDPSVFYVYYSKKFWIVIALLIYFSSTLFLFIYAATFPRPGHSNFWGINNIFDIIKNLLFTISFGMQKNKKPDYPLENIYGDMLEDVQ